MVIKMIFNVNDNELLQVLESNKKIIMVFAKGVDCGLCHAAEFKINQTYAKKYPSLDIYYIDITTNPSFRGRQLIFSTPTILLFENDKEIFREAGFIDYQKLDRILNIYFNE